VIRTALDSDQLDVFNADVDFIFAYSDIVPDAVAFERRYPNHTVAYIDRGLGDPGNKASIADVETGALQPDQLPDWYDQKAKARIAWLTFYCNRSNLATVHAHLGSRNMFRFVATLDGTIVIPGFVPLVGPDIVQITDAAHLGIHADFSLVLNPGWRPTPRPSALAGALADVGNAQRDLTGIAANLSGVQALLKQME
jgi:hypothetical protein